MRKANCYFIIIFLLLGPIVSSCYSEDREINELKQTKSSGPEETKVDALKIEITSPAEGATVTMTELVRGTVSDPKLNVYILIHPLVTNLWWVQNIPTVGPDGRWQSLCYFGTENNGIGEPFEIIAIATTKQELYKPGDTLKTVPSDILRSTIVTVQREK